MSSAPAQPAPTPIEAPPHFPVAWERPGDPAMFWEREVMHSPTQVTVLDASFMIRWIENGMNFAAERYDMPVRGNYRRINTYIYQCFAPVTFDPAELQEIGRSCEEKIGALFGRQLELWEGETLPELREIYAGWDGFDLEGASWAELRAHFEAAIPLSERVWQIHFLTVFPVLPGMSLFDDLYHDLLGGDSFEAFKLAQGFDNLSLRSDRALYALSRRALASPVVKDVLERCAAGEARAELERSAEGRAWLAELDATLEEYGKRCGLYITLSQPSWIEDQAVVLTTIRDAVTWPDRDHDAELRELAEERERLVVEARARLEGFPESVHGQFELLLGAAQEATVLQEDHNFWIDQRVVYELRRIVLAVGRRLAAAGSIDVPGDVFHLTLDEVLATSPGDDRRPLVAERKAELERFRDVEAPPMLGTLPPGPPPEDAMGRAIVKMFGGRPRPSADPSELHGMAGSPGVARGPARVLRSLADAERLQHGDVLVTETTAPPWTPLFGRAAAVVTDAGGILSHCAVVAREYMIPAVVGTKIGTHVIRDGQLVEVDGSAGTVRILGGA